MRAREDIIRALRCTKLPPAEITNCTGCPYLSEKAIDNAPWLNCDVDQVALDAAELLTKDTETIQKLILDLGFWRQKYFDLLERCRDKK